MKQIIFDGSIRAGGEECFVLEFTDVSCDPYVSDIRLNNGDTNAINPANSNGTDGEQTTVFVNNPFEVTYSTNVDPVENGSLDVTQQNYSITFGS